MAVFIPDFIPLPFAQNFLKGSKSTYSSAVPVSLGSLLSGKFNYNFLSESFLIAELDLLPYIFGSTYLGSEILYYENKLILLLEIENFYCYGANLAKQGDSEFRCDLKSGGLFI